MLPGGGSQFGVVVEFVFKLFPDEGPYGAGVLAYKGQELENMIKIIQVSFPSFTALQSTTPDSLSGLEDDADSFRTAHLALFSSGASLPGTCSSSISIQPHLTSTNSRL